MGIPREPVRLDGRLRLLRAWWERAPARITPRAMNAYSRRRARELGLGGSLRLHPQEELAELRHGAGEGVRRRGAECRAAAGWGSSPRALMERHPLLPVEEEGRLTTPCCARTSSTGSSPTAAWKDFLAERYTTGRLVAFHTAHKLLLLSHSPKRYVELGRLVARAKALGAAAAKAQYGQRVHGGGGRAHDGAQTHQRAAAHGGVLETGSGSRLRAPSSPRSSTTTGPASCRWSSPSRCSGITRGR